MFAINSSDGRRLSFTASTQKECQAWLKQIILDLEKGFTLDGNNVKLRAFLEDWLVSIKSSRS